MAAMTFLMADPLLPRAHGLLLKLPYGLRLLLLLYLLKNLQVHAAILAALRLRSGLCHCHGSCACHHTSQW
jgi:hypothetical protein